MHLPIFLSTLKTLSITRFKKSFILQKYLFLFHTFFSFATLLIEQRTGIRGGTQQIPHKVVIDYMFHNVIQLPTCEFLAPNDQLVQLDVFI